MYRALADSIAGDRDLLEIAAIARHGPAPNLFLAAVHDLLMQGRGEDLSAYYPTIVGANALPPAGAPTAFRDFVLSNPAALEPALRSRLVQTNEVRRSGVIYLSLCWLRVHFDLEGIALVEVGASAGLLLAADHFGYRLGTVTTGVTDEPGLVIESELRGECPVVHDMPPEILDRIGIDLATLDMSDESDRRWLRALIWGDQPERLSRLEAAIAVARRTPMTLLEGDANEIMPSMLQELPPGLPAVVFHSHALNQFSPAARERFDEILRTASRDRPVLRIAMEGRAPHPHPICAASVYRDGEMVESSDLACYDAHGAWIEWLS